MATSTVVDLSENCIENIVAFVFQKINQESDKINTNIVLKLLASFITPDKSDEYASLEQEIQKMSFNGLIGKIEMKLALLVWKHNIENKIELNSLHSINAHTYNEEYNGPKSYTNFRGPDDLEHHIEILQNELEKKEHNIITLKSQLQHLDQQIHQHEEAYNIIVSEKFSLEEKLKKEQCIINSLQNIKEEHDELMDYCLTMKENKKNLENKLETLKSENTSLQNEIDSLSNDKQNLSKKVSKLEKDKELNINDLVNAEISIEKLKLQLNEISDDLFKKEEIIKNLCDENFELNAENESLKISNIEKVNIHSEYFDSLIDVNLENQLEIQKKINTDLMFAIEGKNEENEMLKREIKNLSQLIENMETCLRVWNSCYHCMNYTIENLRVRVKLFLYIMRRHYSFVETRHRDISLKISDGKKTKQNNSEHSEIFKQQNDVNQIKSRCNPIKLYILIILFFMCTLIIVIYYLGKHSCRYNKYYWTWFHEFLSIFFEMNRFEHTPF